MLGNARNVLLVEDNSDDEELTLRELRETHLNNPVDVAHDGQEAIDYLFGTEQQPAKPLPAVVLLDLQLPRLGGLEVLKRIRAVQRTRRLPVVILTSSTEHRDLTEGYDSGANSYVCKPIKFDQFTSAIKQLGIYWLVINEQPPPVDEDDRARASGHGAGPLPTAGR
jgi:two-component system, response regulator